MAALSFELLQHLDPDTDKPDSDITVACWTREDGFFSGFWDAAYGVWIDCATGAPVESTVIAWADPRGPLENAIQPPPAEVPVDQVRAALSEALDLMRGWVNLKCAKKHQAEHLAVIKVLAEAGGLPA